MSVDTVIHSITSLRQWVIQHPENFHTDDQRRLLLVLDCMRDPLMKENIAEFDRYVDSLLARQPDTADFVLEEMFEHLNIGTRDELTAVLVAA